jgi:hypothetical protein
VAGLLEVAEDAAFGGFNLDRTNVRTTAYMRFRVTGDSVLKAHTGASA